MPRRRAGSGWWLLGLAPLCGCASLALHVARGLPDGGRECPGELVSSEAIAGDFLLREPVRVQAENLDWRLTLVAQKRGDTLVVIGLDAFGAKEFVVTQTGVELAVERPRGRLPMPPVNLLRDLHRARFASAQGSAEAGVTIERSAAGVVTIEHAGCGYRTTLAGSEAKPSPAAAP